MRSVLLWLALLLVGAAVAERIPITQSSPLYDQLSDYEVTTVRRVGAAVRALGEAPSPDVEAFPEAVEYVLEAFGKEHRLVLHRNEHVISPDYREVVVGANNEVVRELTAADRPNCYYRGFEIHSGRSASFSTCNGLSGAFFSPGLGMVNVEPAHQHVSVRGAAGLLSAASAEHGGSHLVFLSQHLKNAPAKASCGVDGAALGGLGIADGAHKHSENDHDHHGHDHHDHDHDHHDVGNNKNGRGRSVRVQANLEVEMLIFHDRARYALLGDFALDNALTLLNHANNAYLDASNVVGFTDNIKLFIRRQAAWSHGDPYDPANATCSGCVNVKSADSILNSLVNNVLTNTSYTFDSISNYDNSFLLTGYNVGSASSDGVVGLARVGTMCNTFRQTSAGLVETTPGLSYFFQGITLAHELGHNFGFQHDQTYATCNASTWIMSVSSNPGNPPTSFSNCSRDEFNDFIFKAGNRSCLEDGHTAVLPACGNGIIDGSEECDCGPLGCAGVDRCCNVTSCMFLGGSPCSELDACCEFVSGSMCALKSNTSVCRAAVDATCDLAETCTGSSRFCPADLFAGAGFSCGTDGACFAGRCVTALANCQAENPNYVDAGFTEQTTQTTHQHVDYCAQNWCRQGNLLYGLGPERDGTPCSTDGSKLCYQAVCTPTATVASTAQGLAGFNATWGNFSAYSECICDTQSRTADCLVDGVPTNSTSVCFPLPVLTQTCVVPANSTHDPTDCPGVCKTDQFDIPKIGCTQKNYIWYACGGVGALILLCILYFCCCTKSKV